MRPARVPSKARLTDDMVSRFPLPAAKHKPYRVQDADQPRLWLVVSPKNRIWLLRREQGGRSMDTRIGRAPGMTVADARKEAGDVLHKISRGEDHTRPTPKRGKTLSDAWAYFQQTKTKGGKIKSPRTVKSYQDAFDMLREFHDVPLKALADEPQRVVDAHARLSEERGATTADAAMRFLRACYRTYAKARLDPSLRPEMYPTSAITWHGKTRTEKGLGTAGLPNWIGTLLARVNDPVRREMHLFTLLTGIRRGDIRPGLGFESSGVTTLRWADVSVRRREVTLRNAKGGKEVVLPLSRLAVRSLARARVAGRVLYAAHAIEWVFPSATGRISEVKETSWHTRDGKKIKTTRLAPVGHQLRNSFATMAEAAGVGGFRLKVLMAHSLGNDITDWYKSDAALRPQLREDIEKIASFMAKHARVDFDTELTRMLREKLAQ